MKHIFIIGLVLGGLILFLNRGRIRTYFQAKLHHAVEQVLPVSKTEPPAPTLTQTNTWEEVNLPRGATNVAQTTTSTNWPSALAQDYANIIQTIRQTRGN